MKFPSANFETDTIFSNAGTSEGARKGWLTRHGHGVHSSSYAARDPYTKAIQGIADKANTSSDGDLETHYLSKLQEVTDRSSLDRLYDAAVDLNMTPAKNAIRTRLFELRHPPGNEQSATAKAPSIKAVQRVSNSGTSEGAAKGWLTRRLGGIVGGTFLKDAVGEGFHSYSKIENENGVFHLIKLKPDTSTREAAKILRAKLVAGGVPQQHMAYTTARETSHNFQISEDVDTTKWNSGMLPRRGTDKPHYFEVRRTV